MVNRTYEELIQFDTYEDRLAYLKLDGKVGAETMGGQRLLGQGFYRSKEWRNIRSIVITRDHGLDMGVVGYPILGNVYVHHIVPVTPEMIKRKNQLLTHPSNLITVSFDTHQAIHFGFKANPRIPPKERTPGDTTLW